MAEILNEEEGENREIVILILFLIILVYVILQSLMEHVHFHYIHETGIGILLGGGFGAILHYAVN